MSADLNTNQVIDCAKVLHAKHPGFSWHQLFAIAAVALDLPDPDVAATLAETEALRLVAEHAAKNVIGETESAVVQQACDDFGFDDDLCFAEMALHLYAHRQRQKYPPPVPPNFIPANNMGRTQA